MASRVRAPPVRGDGMKGFSRDEVEEGGDRVVGYRFENGTGGVGESSTAIVPAFDSSVLTYFASFSR